MFRRFLSFRILSSLMAAALGFTACDPSSQEPTAAKTEGDSPSLTPERLAAYDAETERIKARLSDPAEIDGALRELNTRFGIPNPVSHASFAEPAASAASGKALSKAATAVLYLRVKDLDVTYPFATAAQVEVPNGTTVTATTNRIDASLDPYLVAYYNPSMPFGEPWDDYTSHHSVAIAGLNDDGAGNLNSKIVWTNNTGDTRMVYFVTFAYSSSRVGRGQTKYVVSDGSNDAVLSSRVTATRVFANTNSVPAGCTSNGRSRIGLTKLSGPEYVYGAGLLAVNTSSRIGANIWDRDALVSMPTQIRPDNGWVLPYLQNEIGKDDPEPNHYSAIQDDLFTCSP